MSYLSKLIGKSLNDLLAKLSVRHDRRLRDASQNNVVKLDGVKFLKFDLDVLSLSPMHPVRDNCNEVAFIEDVDSLFREIKENNVVGEKLCETE